MKGNTKMTKPYENTWINVADSVGLGGSWATTPQEREQAQFVDLHCACDCACGGRFEYRPTCGVLVCTHCGDIKTAC